MKKFIFIILIIAILTAGCSSIEKAEIFSYSNEKRIAPGSNFGKEGLE